MAKNKISDLRDHLFSQLERLNDETISAEDMGQEINKAKAISSIGHVIINSAKIEIDFIKATGRMDTASDLFKGLDDTKALDK